MRFPEPSNIATLQELPGGDWVAYSQGFGEVKALSSLEIEVLSLCDGERSEQEIVEVSGRSAEEVSRLLDFLTMKGLLVSDVLPEVVPDLVGAQVGDELVLYSSKTSAAHKLSATLARVYNACLGQERRDTLKAEFAASGGGGAEALDSAVLELETAGLIQVRPNNISRRKFFSTGAKAAAAVGIASVLAPTAAHAAASSCSGCVASGGCSAGNCGTCCNPSGINCNGQRMCYTYYYYFETVDDYQSGNAGPGCTQVGNNHLYTHCEDICSDLVINGDEAAYACCISGPTFPPPDQNIGGPCLLCSSIYARRMCVEEGTHVTCCTGGPNDGRCGYVNGTACSSNGQCCSGNCDTGGTNTCVA